MSTIKFWVALVFGCATLALFGHNPKSFFRGRIVEHNRQRAFKKLHAVLQEQIVQVNKEIGVAIERTDLLLTNRKLRRSIGKKGIRRLRAGRNRLVTLSNRVHSPAAV